MLLQFLNNINETYNEKNMELLKYMKTDIMDSIRIENYSKVLAEYFENHPEIMNIAKQLANKEMHKNYDDYTFLDDVKYETIDGVLFYNLDEKILNDIKKFIITWTIERRSSLTPTPIAYELNTDNLAKRNTWLVHFSDHAYHIIRDGFTIGVSDLSVLGNTEILPKEYRKNSGYNFAYEISDVFNDMKVDYGNEAVVFQSSGVKMYHGDDQEDHYAFWGPSINPRDMVWITKSGFKELKKNEKYTNKYNNIIYHGQREPKIDMWTIKKHPRSSHPTKKENILTSDIHTVVFWIKNHWRQYSKIIMGY